MNFIKRTTILAAGLLCLAGAAKAQDFTNSNYFTPVTGDVASPDANGFIGRWLLLEPFDFPNSSNTVFVDSYIRETFAKFSDTYLGGDLAKVPTTGKKGEVIRYKTQYEKATFRGFGAPQAPEIVKVDRKLKWHALDSKLFNVKLMRFASDLNRDKYGLVFWAVTVIDVPEDMTVRLAVGSNSASMWWIDGEEALILSGDRRMVADDGMSARMTLTKGKHVLRGAVINGPGMSDICVRFVDENLKPVKNYTISTTK